MSARNYWSNAELVKNAVYNRSRERHWRRQAAAAIYDANSRDDYLRWANNCHLRAQASEDVLTRRIEEQLKRVNGVF